MYIDWQSRIGLRQVIFKPHKVAQALAVATLKCERKVMLLRLVQFPSVGIWLGSGC